MKQLITLMLLIASMQMQAQKIKDVINPSITSWGTSFLTPMTDTKWSNVNGRSYTKAKYVNFSGTTAAGMTASANVEATLHLSVVVAKGIFRIVMEDNKGNVVLDKEFSEDTDLITDVSLTADVPYVIKFIGANTKGSYFCQWIQKTI